MKFCTAVNCMDGRVQLPVIRHLEERFGCLYVDSVTEAGPVRSLALGGLRDEERPGRASDRARTGDAEPRGGGAPEDVGIRESILRRVSVSFDAHGSRLIAVVAHADCAGNSVPDDEQKRELRASVDFLSRTFPPACVIGLWVDESWSVSEVCRSGESDAGPAARGR